MQHRVTWLVAMSLFMGSCAPDLISQSGLPRAEPVSAADYVTARNAPMPDIQMAQSAVARGVKEKLKNPNSAQFKYGPLQRGIVYKPPLIKWDGIFMCGAVNARNSYGGYGGFHPFFAYLIGDDAVVEMDDVDSFNATDYCRSIVPVD